jgi:hypothetical protein
MAEEWMKEKNVIKECALQCKLRAIQQDNASKTNPDDEKFYRDSSSFTIRGATHVNL